MGRKNVDSSCNIVSFLSNERRGRRPTMNCIKSTLEKKHIADIYFSLLIFFLNFLFPHSPAPRRHRHENSILHRFLLDLRISSGIYHSTQWAREQLVQTENKHNKSKKKQKKKEELERQLMGESWTMNKSVDEKTITNAGRCNY